MSTSTLPCDELQRSRILDGLNRQRLEGKMCDVTFVLGSATFRAHSCIIALTSPYLLGHLKSTSLWSSQNPLHINLSEIMEGKQTCLLCFSVVLSYMYNSQVTFECSHVEHIYNLANFLEIKELVELCLKYMAESQMPDQKSAIEDSDQNKLQGGKIDMGPFCDLCYKGFDSLESLFRHKRVLHNHMFICLKCDLMSHKLMIILDHVLDDCPPGDICPICLFETEDPSKMRDHILDHKEPDPFACLACHQRFNSRPKWRKHLCHDISKSFTCRHCGKSFTKISTYQQHISRHNSKMVYSCELCGFSSPYKSYLKRHMSKHTVLEFTCPSPKCSFTSQWENSIKRHAKTAHGGSKVYKCPLCNIEFSYKRNLNRHLKQAHGNKKFTCQLCSYKSPRLDKLKIHCITHHFKNIEATEKMLKDYKEVPEIHVNDFIPSFKRTKDVWKVNSLDIPSCESLDLQKSECSSPSNCLDKKTHQTGLLSESTDDTTLLGEREGESVPISSVTSTNLLTIGNFKEGAGGVVLKNNTGILALNNITSESARTVFLNQSTREISCINLNQENDQSAVMEGCREEPSLLLNEVTGEISVMEHTSTTEADESFQDSMFDTPDFNFLYEDSMDEEEFDGLIPYLNETTGELSFELRRTWNEVEQLSISQDIPQLPADVPEDFSNNVLDEETGELICLNNFK